MTSHSESMSPERQKFDQPVEEADELPSASQVRFDNPVQARNRLAWTHNIVEQAKRAFLPRRLSPEQTRTVTAAAESSNGQAEAPKAEAVLPPLASSTSVAQAPQIHWGFGGFAPTAKSEETDRVNERVGGLQSEDLVKDTAAAGTDEEIEQAHIEEKEQGQDQSLTAALPIDEAPVTLPITEDEAVALPAVPEEAVIDVSASQNGQQQSLEPELNAQADSIAPGKQQQLHKDRIEAALQDRHHSELASDEASREPVAFDVEQPSRKEPTEIDQEGPQDPDESSLQDVIMVDGTSPQPSGPSAAIATAALAEQESEDELEDESGQSSIDAAPAAAVVAVVAAAAVVVVAAAAASAASASQTGGEQLDDLEDVVPPVDTAVDVIDLRGASPSASPAAASGAEEQDQLDGQQDVTASQQQMSLQANPGGSWSATEDEASMEPIRTKNQESQASAQAAGLPVEAEPLQPQSQTSSSPLRTSPPRPEDIDSLPFSIASETQAQRLSESLAPGPFRVEEEVIAIASQSLPADEVEASSEPSEPLVKNPIRSRKVVVIDSESSDPSEVRPTPATSQPLADKIAPEVIVIDSQSQQVSRPQQPREDVNERLGPDIVVIDSQSQQPAGEDQLAAASSSRNTSSTSSKQVEASLSAIPWPTPAQRPIIPPMSEDELEIRAVERSRLMSLRAQRRSCVQIVIEGRPQRAAKDQHQEDKGPSRSKPRLLPHDDEESQPILPAGMRKTGTQPSTSTLRIDAQKKDKTGQTRLQFTKMSGGGERQTTTQSSARKSRFIVADESSDSASEHGSSPTAGPSRRRQQRSEEMQKEDDASLRPREACLAAMDVGSDSSMDQVPRAPTREERQERQRKRTLLSGSSKSEASQIMTDAESEVEKSIARVDQTMARLKDAHSRSPQERKPFRDKLKELREEKQILEEERRWLERQKRKIEGVYHSDVDDTESSDEEEVERSRKEVVVNDQETPRVMRPLGKLVGELLEYAPSREELEEPETQQVDTASRLAKTIRPTLQAPPTPVRHMPTVMSPARSTTAFSISPQKRPAPSQSEEQAPGSTSTSVTEPPTGSAASNSSHIQSTSSTASTNKNKKPRLSSEGQPPLSKAQQELLRLMRAIVD